MVNVSTLCSRVKTHFVLFYGLKANKKKATTTAIKPTTTTTKPLLPLNSKTLLAPFYKFNSSCSVFYNNNDNNNNDNDNNLVLFFTKSTHTVIVCSKFPLTFFLTVKEQKNMFYNITLLALFCKRQRTPLTLFHVLI